MGIRVECLEMMIFALLSTLRVRFKSVEQNPAMATTDGVCSTRSAEAKTRSSDESAFGNQCSSPYPFVVD